MITNIGTALIILTAAQAWLFCIGYQLSAPWQRSETGRHLMSLTGALAVVMTLWSIGALFPIKGQWWEITRLIAFIGIPLALGHRLWLLYRLQIRPALRNKENGDRHDHVTRR